MMRVGYLAGGPYAKMVESDSEYSICAGVLAGYSTIICYIPSACVLYNSTGNRLMELIYKLTPISTIGLSDITKPAKVSHVQVIDRMHCYQISSELLRFGGLSIT